MIYKRATKALREAGIYHIVIVKRLWGPAPEDTRAIEQTSRCFDTWQQARDAVLEGYRPKVIRFRLTPVASDGAGGQTGDVEGETRPAPEHD